ncbi:hypothetical protein BJ138DRAFT_1150357 [Hygrophoropsis aurantiaca]|uniref:Uncharacterized protein n=1 Tax=Hygrophoropsis aurantiaca TaxID=72124 RepID=A0ACB8AE65_9AGAM|nr:hypothetical protein BJ138DRAFT_1150357 [Hygrophoropsis aurantiaca]
MFFKGVFILIISAAANLAIATNESRCELASQPSKVPHGFRYQLTVYGTTDCYYDSTPKKTSQRFTANAAHDGSCFRLSNITSNHVESISFASTNKHAYAYFYYDDNCEKFLPVDKTKPKYHPLPAGKGVSTTTGSNIHVEQEMRYISSVMMTESAM